MSGEHTDASDDGGSTGGPDTDDATGEAVCRGDAPECYCPIEGVVDLLARKYAMQIVCVVGAHGTVRFREIEGHLPTASTSTLSARLEDLREAGLIDRAQYDEIPPRVEYSLTDEGRELQARLEPLLRWARERDRTASTAD